MASYAAVSSLKHTIKRLLNSSTIFIRFAYKEVKFLQVYLERLGNSRVERVNVVSAQIREAACKLENAILSQLSDLFLSQTEDQINIGADQILSVGLKEVEQELYSFVETAKSIMEDNRIEDLLDEEYDVSLRIDFGGKCTKMVGFSSLYLEIKHMLTDIRTIKLDFVSLLGMAGIGKTTLAMKIFEDPKILSHFEHQAFVTMGPRYKLSEVILDILIQLTPDSDEMHNKGVKELGKYLFETLRNRRYLIVSDDVWDRSIYELVKYLPNDNNFSRILVTTHLDDVAYELNRKACFRMPFLNEEESWDLLLDRVFGEEYLCPIQLEKHGKKIAKNCGGLPHAILTVANILSKNEKIIEYWKKTAEEKNSILTNASDLIFSKLFPYDKSFVLYMGVFPPSWKITTSKIVKLLSAEGFLESYSGENVEHFARRCLERIASNNLASIHQWSFRFGAKTLSLHSAYWYIKNLARMEKFFHVIDSYPDSISPEDIKNQQRLCVHNNVLLGIKEVQDKIKSISTLRSFLCIGPHHRYPVSICFGLRLLRVLDAVTVRFYKFPIEVLKLVLLKYLALTCNGNVPASICKLWSLEYFLVRRHLSIKPFGAWPYLPMEIWNMKELRHLQVMGSNLPYHCGATLPNLLTLSDMSADSCTAAILRGTPNLEKLGIQIELPPDAAEPLSFFDHLSHLHKLRSLKCIIVNPKPRSHVVAPLTAFPSNLRKLNLSGFGYPWKYMSMIAELPYLGVLKLQRYAFQGPEWKIEGEFRSLQFLLIEETDLVQWVADSCCFPMLGRLMVRHCYKLKEIPDILDLEMIELVDCPISELCKANDRGKQ